MAICLLKYDIVNISFIAFSSELLISNLIQIFVNIFARISMSEYAHMPIQTQNLK